MKSGKKCKAKLFYTHFSQSENMLVGWNAVPVGEGVFKVNRRDGTTRDMAIGEEIPGHGKVTIDRDYHCLKVGNYSIQMGQNVAHGWKAKPVKVTEYDKTEGKNKNSPGYLITSPENKFYGPFKVGDKVTIPENNDLNNCVLEEGKAGGVTIGSISVPLTLKQYELRLLVMDKRDGYGYEAYFNVIKPGDKANGKNGTKGIFIPAKDESPALFCETMPGDSYLYRTAQFWPVKNADGTKNQKAAVGNIRDIEKAVKERNIYTAYKDLEKTISDAIKEFEGLEDAGEEFLTSLNEEKDALANELARSNDDWGRHWFSVNMGYNFALPEPKKKSLETQEFSP